MESKLSQGEIVAQVELPHRNPPRQMLLRARVPEGWQVLKARSASRELSVDERGTADISSLKGSAQVNFDVKRR
jgi:hypothetical protein